MLLPIRECPIASTWNSIIFRLQFSATTVLMDESMETSIRLRGTPPGAPSSAPRGRCSRTRAGGDRHRPKAWIQSVHARRVRAATGFFAGSSRSDGARGPSDPHDQGAGGRGATPVVAGLRPAVFADGAAVDSAGAFAEGMPADVPVQHPQ